MNPLNFNPKSNTLRNRYSIQPDGYTDTVFNQNGYTDTVFNQNGYTDTVFNQMATHIQYSTRWLHRYSIQPDGYTDTVFNQMATQ